MGQRRKDGSCILIVKVADADCKRKILNRSKSLKSSASLKNVYIKPDLPTAQQMNDKRLRDELKVRRDKGEDAVIFRGNIIARSNLPNF